MRIWDLEPSLLCRKHLLGEHRELHGLWNILTLGKTGYLHHPETQRWIGRLHVLLRRHEALCKEMAARGWNHKSPLALPPDGLQEDDVPQDRYVDSPARQIELIRAKGCDCRV